MAEPTLDQYELPDNFADMDEEQLRALADALHKALFAKDE
jgi:hypothetical protein